eukprot:TRINITY_DN15786_c0_g1_i2.p2 TRINITY_DN15786_c0_g1~~TRINITY_DN15786_c0_g1_i2.p2  ORF type:complete len:180 (+),score=33.78 TRINITY_DN15786_c0_g1_i2:247-786(+)
MAARATVTIDPHSVAALENCRHSPRASEAIAAAVDSSLIMEPAYLVHLCAISAFCASVLFLFARVHLQLGSSTAQHFCGDLQYWCKYVPTCADPNRAAADLAIVLPHIVSVPPQCPAARVTLEEAIDIVRANDSESRAHRFCAVSHPPLCLSASTSSGLKELGQSKSAAVVTDKPEAAT